MARRDKLVFLESSLCIKLAKDAFTLCLPSIGNCAEAKSQIVSSERSESSSSSRKVKKSETETINTTTTSIFTDTSKTKNTYLKTTTTYYVKPVEEQKPDWRDNGPVIEKKPDWRDNGPVIEKKPDWRDNKPVIEKKTPVRTTLTTQPVWLTAQLLVWIPWAVALFLLVSLFAIVTTLAIREGKERRQNAQHRANTNILPENPLLPDYDRFSVSPPMPTGWLPMTTFPTTNIKKQNRNQPPEPVFPAVLPVGYYSLPKPPKSSKIAMEADSNTSSSSVKKPRLPKPVWPPTVPPSYRSLPRMPKAVGAGSVSCTGKQRHEQKLLCPPTVPTSYNSLSRLHRATPNTNHRQRPKPTCPPPVPMRYSSLPKLATINEPPADPGNNWSPPPVRLERQRSIGGSLRKHNRSDYLIGVQTKLLAPPRNDTGLLHQIQVARMHLKHVPSTPRRRAPPPPTHPSDQIRRAVITRADLPSDHKSDDCSSFHSNLKITKL